MFKNISYSKQQLKNKEKIRELDKQIEELEIEEQDMLENARQSRFRQRLRPTRRLQKGDR